MEKNIVLCYRSKRAVSEVHIVHILLPASKAPAEPYQLECTTPPLMHGCPAAIDTYYTFLQGRNHTCYSLS